MMNSYLTCTFEGHENEQIIGFCVNEICTQIPQFCLQCLKERHKNHVEDCKNFQQYQEIVIKSLKQQQQELDELENVYNKINKAYKQYSQILVNEISKKTKLIEMFAQRQYYDIKSLIYTQNYSQKSFMPKTQCMCQKYFLEHFLSFIQTIENAIKGSTKLNHSQEFVQQPIQYQNDKVQSQELFKQGSNNFNLIRHETIWEQQNFSEALNFFNESIKYDASNDDVYRWKGRTLIKLGKANEALNACDIAISINPQNDLAYTTKASALFEQRRYDDVIIWCDKGLKINPQNDAAFVNKGLALGRLYRYQEELMCYDKSIEINRKNETAYINKGCALNRQKQYQEAISCSDELLKINSQLHQAYSIKGIALYELSQYKEAVKQFDKAYQISKLVEYLVHKADSLFYSGQKRQSKQLYLEAKNKGYQDIEYLERKISEI
ncbi:unnamed protein product (macronuclear) [Paramecium tetraurelia]|uniref:Uncharacterized protein n=1 Tax=Paramecium tetraurelia TaxID=5888 RepID=A0EIT4_PARTE|nr:uncharacterized protein GSPATT00027554001 [Paramecium tetraurelia]CAK95225.1 unnamed protein product [Paramecium tetraurelia]|eukprot:XP_001462598.1 hypothetical protein (macronuclear) [Paramecium tetraurelia strain d4-2]